MRMTATRRRARVALRIGGAVLVGALAAACGPTRRYRTEPEKTTIQVDNRAFSDMTIYVVEGGSRRRLGLAVGASTTTFTIPPTVVGVGRELQFLADPIGSIRTALTNRIYVTPGQEVTMVIPPS